MKQETLEEAAQKRFPIDHNLSILERIGLNSAANMGFIEGAKWQQERSYSEEEVLNINNWYLETFLDDALGLNGKDAEQKIKHLSGKGLTKEVLNYWFEQFKKK